MNYVQNWLDGDWTFRTSGRYSPSFSTNKESSRTTSFDWTIWEFERLEPDVKEPTASKEEQGEYNMKLSDGVVQDGTQATRRKRRRYFVMGWTEPVDTNGDCHYLLCASEMLVAGS